MYNSSDVADAIKKTAQTNKISVKQVLSDAGLGANTMSNFKTSMPKADNLAKIADVLDCSVDYLLGRTDNPQSHKGEKTGTQILIERLTTEEQELITAQVRGILASRSAEPTQKIWLAASSTDDQAPAIVEASKARIKAAQDDHSLQNEEDI